MIAPDELIDIKNRLLVGAEVARKMASTEESLVFYDQQQYEIVVSALSAMTEDINRVLAELDILRGMFSERLTSFFQQATKGVDADVPERVDPNPVEVLPAVPDTGSGEEVRKVNKRAARGVQAERPVRKRGRRSKSASHQGAVQGDSTGLGREDAN